MHKSVQTVAKSLQIIDTGEGRKRAMAAGVKFGRKRKLSDYQRAEASSAVLPAKRLASIAKSYGVHLAVISRL